MRLTGCFSQTCPAPLNLITSVYAIHSAESAFLIGPQQSWSNPGASQCSWQGLQLGAHLSPHWVGSLREARTVFYSSLCCVFRCAWGLFNSVFKKWGREEDSAVGRQEFTYKTPTCRVRSGHSTGIPRCPRSAGLSFSSPKLIIMEG